MFYSFNDYNLLSNNYCYKFKNLDLAFFKIFIIKRNYNIYN